MVAGVPQGGSILHNLYTSDVTQLPAGCNLALYAWDSEIIANGRTPMQYQSQFQQGVTAYVAYRTA